jgi:TPR repeat protein
VDLLNVPYSQQVAPVANLGNAALRGAVGANASLLETAKTLDMYRANVKKTQDPSIQYEFAVFMVDIAREIVSSGAGVDSHGLDPAAMLREARQILQRLADKSYPFAQYYLADGYASGLFNKDKPDYDRAFPLFVSASKHGHAEAGYRAALCYEFGWGCRKDYAKAVQFFRAAASKAHPGAATRLGKACLTGDMGLGNRYREGIKWLKRAVESADYQHNSAPYELGLLHETGYGDDIFKDEVYAVQLFTQAAELGHPLAALKLGEAYEHGHLCCPKDAALSVHYYNCAAQAEIPEAMMNLCAWYMVGAEPVLEKDENEAYEWAKRAAEHGLPKAEYACGYFTEMGIGCRRDPLEANVWYVKAADHGDDRAKQRLAIIHATASGGMGAPSTPPDKSKLKKGGKDENCVVM